MPEPDTTTSPSRQLFDDAVRALTAAARLDSGPDYAELGVADSVRCPVGGTVRQTIPRNPAI